jgi:hypothetical protein
VVGRWRSNLFDSFNYVASSHNRPCYLLFVFIIVHSTSGHAHFILPENVELSFFRPNEKSCLAHFPARFRN